MGVPQRWHALAFALSGSLHATHFAGSGELIGSERRGRDRTGAELYVSWVRPASVTDAD